MAKVTITNMLLGNNVVIPKQPFSAEQEKQAILKYGDGESLARIGAEPEVSLETVRRCPLAEGVAPRARPGRRILATQLRLRPCRLESSAILK